ncbi:Cell growth-regulating nucleolar protein [Myotis davidii]|uniref:Cell growth-regulating nucleolar protein n=1 Tax=Myotis davidii TaxID=225400 RepID=L5MCG9_MYODS|nr:Cell growth-regulating nucleolar protein [Myotis davidii]
MKWRRWSRLEKQEPDLSLPDGTARAFTARSSLCEAAEMELREEFLLQILSRLQELGSMVHTKLNMALHRAEVSAQRGFLLQLIFAGVDGRFPVLPQREQQKVSSGTWAFPILQWNCERLFRTDCGKDFWGEDYKNHVKGISEDQKYGGKGYEGKAHRGDIKQQAWVQKVNELMKRPTVSPKVRELLEQISGFDNIPRKKAKLQEPAKITTTGAPSNANDTTQGQAEAKKNERERKEERQKKRKKEKKELKLEHHQEKTKNQMSKKRKMRPEAEQETGGEGAPEAMGPEGNKSQGPRSTGECGVNGDVDKEETNMGKRKRKLSEVEEYSKKKKIKFPGLAEGEEPENHGAPAKGKFNWKGTMKAVLKQAPDNETAVKKLRKKVLAQYYAVTNEHHRSEEELLAIFNKKVSKSPAFKLLKDKIKLLK